MDKTYAEALDDILSLINKSNAGHVAYTAIKKHLVDKFNFTEDEVKLLFQKLRQDSFISDSSISTGYVLTFSGKDFLKRGGYKKQEKITFRKNMGQFWTNTFLIVGALATTSIAVFEGLKFFDKTKESNPVIQSNNSTHIQDTLINHVIKIQKDPIQLPLIKIQKDYPIKNQTPSH